MKLEIISEKQNDLLQRKEVVVRVAGGKAPTRLELLEEAPKVLKTERACIVVNSITPTYGANGVTAQIDVYASPDALKKFAHPKLVARGEPKKEEKK
ncbi:hypothetical protein AUJ14_05900 [Candidatus Micrarchaeota archaeon CG1_02_55_22]|nr:MAG: hypothetical protein AUJ14_05900 [Candidatus Micrarchaeota archaeon CG1_02_55_22]